MADKRKPSDGGDVVLAKRARHETGLVSGSTHELVHTEPRHSVLSAPVIALRQAHTAEILDAVFSRDGNTIAAASADHTISLWETFGTNRNIGLLRGHARAVTAAAWLPPLPDEDAMLVSASADGTLILWSAETGEKLRRYRGHHAIVNCVICAPTEARIASGSDDGRVLFWAPDARRPVDSLDVGYPVTAIEFSADGTQLFVGGVDNAVHAYSLKTKQRVFSLQGHTDTVASLALSPKGTHLVSVGMDDSVRIWDVRPYAPDVPRGAMHDPRLVRTLTGMLFGFESLLIKGSWSADGEHVASGGGDRSCTVWNVESGKIEYKLPGHRGSCTAAIFHPREPVLLTASTDWTMLLAEIELQ